MFETIAEHFNRLAPTYDANALYQLVGRAEIAAIDRLLPPDRGAVLDFGCGTGRFSLPLALRHYDVTGYDIAGSMVAQARVKAQQLGVSATFTDDAAAIANRQWPLVLSIGVLDYYRDPLILLRQIVPYITPGGMLIVGAPNLYGPFSWGHALICLFRLRMYLHTAASLQAAGENLGLRTSGVTYAFPAIAPVGMSVLLSYRRQ
jgi:2-polyprenyl-3-methyl-5-hydroxy-6-metoxy-1,4-benzoquinol methylase